MISKVEKQVTALTLVLLMCLSVLLPQSVLANAETARNKAVQSVTAGTQNETVEDGTDGQKFYQFIPEKSGKYRFYSMGDEDTYGNVYNAGLELICSGNDKGESLSFDMTLPMEAGQVYYLEPKYFLDNAKGTITWCIEPAAEETEEENTVPEYMTAEDKTAVSKQTEVKTTENYTYRELEDGTVEVTAYTGTEEQVKIPEKFNGKSVTSIGANAFCENNTITKVEIPGTVTELQYGAFISCENLTEVVFPKESQLHSIGKSAFHSCKSLKFFECPDNVEIISNRAFMDCENLAQIELGKKLTTIEDWAFAWSGLTKVILPNSLKNIGDSIFSGCDNLNDVSIGSGIKTLSFRMFYGCDSLKQIKIPDTITTVESCVFYSSGLERIDIPSSVVSIGNLAFAHCGNLKEVKIGDGMTYIPFGAFEGCDLENIQIGNRVKEIGRYAFERNKNLKKLSIPENVTSLEYKAFNECTNLKDIEFPDNLEKLGGHVFRETAWYESQPDGLVYVSKVLYGYKGEMPKDAEVKIKDGTVGIGGYAFDSYANLKSIEIPDSVTNIGDWTFYKCTSLKEIEIPNSVIEIGWRACGYNGHYENQKIEGFTIIGDVGSAAEKYATENDIPFRKSIHTVTFKDGDTVLETQNITSGEDAVPATLQNKVDYIFDGWDKDYINVKEDLVITAKWKPKDGWKQTDDGMIYYENGKKVTDWKEIDGKYYYFNENGIMLTDQWIGDYYVDKNGVWLENYRPAQWMITNGRWWYREVDGSYPTSQWKEISNIWYYFDASGYCVTGWNYINGAWYYMDASGAMCTGWVSVGGRWYYLNNSGAMETGWNYIDGVWYYMDASGVMCTGWISTGGYWYYMNSNGAMATSQWIGDYYVQADGTMAVNKWIGNYYVDSSGKWVRNA